MIPRSPCLFVPCIVDQFFPNTAYGALEILRSLGLDPIYKPEQTCCGQPAFNTGYHDDAVAVAQKFVEVFSEADEIVSLSGSCAAMVKVFYRNLNFDKRMKKGVERISSHMYEFTEYLVKRLEVTDLGASYSGRVAYHDSCHIMRELHISEEPRRLLQAVKALELVEFDLADRCCGFGGTFSVKFGGLSAAMAEEKLQSIHRANVDYLVGCDSSCLMHLQGLADAKGIKLRTKHIAEFLWENMGEDLRSRKLEV